MKEKEDNKALIEQATTQDNTVYAKDFSEQGFWDKLGTLIRRAEQSVAYIALLLYYTMKSEEVSIRQKLAITGALGYLILPLDLIPDFIPVVGYADDFAAMAAAYRLVKDSITPSIRAQASAKCNSWFNNFDQKKAEKKIEG